MLIFFLTVLPGILFSLLFYFLDKNRKKLNIPFLVLTFIFGGVSSYLCYRLEWHFGSYFKKVAESNLLEVLFYAIFGVAIFEEGLKLFFAFIFSRLNKIKDRLQELLNEKNITSYKLSQDLYQKVHQVLHPQVHRLCYVLQ